MWERLGTQLPYLFSGGNAVPTLIHIFLWERSSYSVPVIAPDSHSNCLLVNSGTKCKLWNSNTLIVQETKYWVCGGCSAIFIARQHIDIANLSVPPSVRPSVRPLRSGTR